MNKVIFPLSLAGALLGALWLIQGLGIVQLRSVVCFADCEPVQGPSATWALIGAIVLLTGGAAALWSWKKRLG